jgi:exopolysaccharide biosynthesis polyprenyl glycosylphosphotransferase
VSSAPISDLALEAFELATPPAPAPRFALGRRAATSIHVGVDATMALAGTIAADYGSRRAGITPLGLWWGLLFAGLFVLFLVGRGMYRPRLQSSLLDDTRSILVSLTIVTTLVLSLGLLVTGRTAGAALAREWAFVAVYVVAGRFALQWAAVNAHRTGRLLKPTLIVGRGRVGTTLAQRLLAHPEMGLKPVAFLDKEPLVTRDAEVDLPVAGASWDLDRVIDEYGIQEIIVAFSTAPDDVLLRLMRRAEERDITVAFVPRFFEHVPQRLTVQHLGGLSLLVPNVVRPRDWHFRVKYTVDWIAAAALLLLSLPVVLLVAAGVRATMGRPIFFRQMRVGRDGKPFEMLKFRSMRTPGSADELSFVLPEDLGPGGIEGVDRITRFGAFLRATNLDELPQLLNVLRGEMSLVGPRPERPEYVARFDEHVYRYSERHRVKAGITGWAQVHGLRGRTSIADRAEWDNFYIENFSLWLDLKIVLLTFASVVRGFLPAGAQR